MLLTKVLRSAYAAPAGGRCGGGRAVPVGDRGEPGPPTILNIALPTISAALHAVHSKTCNGLQFDAYQLVFAAVTLPACFGDRGTAWAASGCCWPWAGGVFLAASLCRVRAPSVSAGELIAARALMGLGAGIVLSLAVSLGKATWWRRARRACSATMTTGHQGHRHPRRGGRARPAARAGALLLKLAACCSSTSPGTRSSGSTCPRSARPWLRARCADARVAQLSPRRHAGRAGRALLLSAGAVTVATMAWSGASSTARNTAGRRRPPGCARGPGRRCCWGQFPGLGRTPLGAPGH